MHDRPLVVDLIELTLNHGLFVVRAAGNLAEAEAILAEWRPHMTVVDMDHDDSNALLERLGSTSTLGTSGVVPEGRANMSHHLGETRLVWLIDPAPMDYVRVGRAVRAKRTRVGPPVSQTQMRRNRNTLVGYAETAEPQHERRYFWLKTADRPIQPDGPYKDPGCPAEAVDLLTLAPNEPGEKNERAWGGPLPR